jgi:hypothetical protein
MKYQILKNKRIPNQSIYILILTLILAFAIVWIIYVSVPYVHYSMYLIESEANKNI